MPGNTVKINNFDGLEWYVGDSRMEELISWLDENGVKTEDTDAIDVGETKDELFKGRILLEWLEDLVYPGKIEDFIHELQAENDPVKGGWKMIMALYTDEHKYQIVAIDRIGEKGYLGCQVSTRKYRAGEDWLRGNDLPDGPFNLDTWNRILNGIIRYELVALSKYLKPDKIPGDVLGPSLNEEEK